MSNYNNYNDLHKISQITDNIYVSGILPIEKNPDYLKNLNIKYILSCVDRSHIYEIHDKILINNPEITILYIPYNDDLNQNLWFKNNRKINILKYVSSMQDYGQIINLSKLYENKPFIEIGYHFIDTAISEKNNILVHCMAGISRSVSLVIYYLMKKHYFSFEKSVSSVRQSRKIANPNDSFKNQLKKYQTKRDRFSEIDANKIIMSYYVS